MQFAKPVGESLFLFVFALVYALIEIEIEGPDGWAKNLPTPQNFCFHLSLYHVYMILLACIVICGFVYFRDTKECLEDNTRSTEYRVRSVVSRVLFMLVAFFLLQDFLWFVMNPSYTVCKYSAQHISWHSPWYFGLPWFNFVGFGLLALAVLISPERSNMLFSIVVLGSLLGLSVAVAPTYHSFYVSHH